MIRHIFLLALFLGLLLGALPGCTVSAITSQARAARLVGASLAGAREAIDAARDADLSTCGELPAPAERLACDDEIMARWAPVVASYNLAREGLDQWTQGLTLALLARMEDADAWSYLLPLASQLFELYQGLQIALEPFEEIDLPEVPNFSAMLGGAR